MTYKELREFRRENGLTQQELADALGVTRREITYLESGTRRIKRHIALACSAIGYSMLYKRNPLQLDEGV